MTATSSGSDGAVPDRVARAGADRPYEVRFSLWPSNQLPWTEVAELADLISSDLRLGWWGRC